MQGKLGNGEELMTVFMPNAPNPTTGFVMFMPAKDVILLDMSIEDGAKMVVSAGLVAPPHAAKHWERPGPEAGPRGRAGRLGRAASFKSLAFGSPPARG